MLKFILKGNFNNTEKFFDGAIELPRKLINIFHRYGKEGVEALRVSTPKDTEETANAWSYGISNKGIFWNNSKNISGAVPLAILLQYGHGTRGGTYIQGIDYINPALKPLFNRIADDIWKEVKAL